jgi:trigger factor
MMNDKAEMVTSRVASPSPSKRELEIEVAADEVAKEWDKVLLEYASRARLDGFRRGKAPREMVKRLFYSDIKDAVVENLVPRALRESLRTEGISPVGTPLISEAVLREGQPFRFKAVVEVLPGFDLPPYTKVRVPKREVKVGEEEVARSLEELRQKSAEYVPVEGRGVVDGDFVVVEWKGRDLKTKRFLPTEKSLVLAGHADNDKALNDVLTGAMPGETRKFVISYPREHAQKRLAGKEIEYEISVSSIKEKRVPDLSDEWAKDLGEYESLAALKEKVRQELDKAKEEAARREIGEEVAKGLVEKLQLELPESLVDDEAVSILRSWAVQLPAGLPSSQVEELKAKAREKARENLKTSLILQKVAQREKLVVGDEEVEEEIKALARRNNVPLAQLIEKVNQEGRREEIRRSLLLRKAIDFLADNAVLY